MCNSMNCRARAQACQVCTGCGRQDNVGLEVTEAKIRDAVLAEIARGNCGLQVRTW